MTHPCHIGVVNRAHPWLGSLSDRYEPPNPRIPSARGGCCRACRVRAAGSCSASAMAWPPRSPCSASSWRRGARRRLDRPASQFILVLLLIDLVLILAPGRGGRRCGWSGCSAPGRRTPARGCTCASSPCSPWPPWLPAVVVALFFGVLVTRGVENWFSQRVQTVVENSATVAQSYVDEQTRYDRRPRRAMAADLNRAAPACSGRTRSAFGRILEGQAADRDFPAAYLIDRRGPGAGPRRGAERAALRGAAAASLRDAADDGVISVAFESADLLRALYRLKAYRRRLSLRRPAGRAGHPQPPARRRRLAAGLSRGRAEPPAASRRSSRSPMSRPRCWCWSARSGWAWPRPTPSPRPSRAWCRRPTGSPAAT